MFYILIASHVTLCVLLIGLVLVQQGKGADAGATFGGGSSNTVLGAGGAADFITKGTTSIAIAFMVTSILLARTYASGGVPTVSVKTADPLAGSVMGTMLEEEQVVPDVAVAGGAEVFEGAEAAASDSAAAVNTEESSEGAEEPTNAAPTKVAAEPSEKVKEGETP